MINSLSGCWDRNFVTGKIIGRVTARDNIKLLEAAQEELTVIAGQKPVMTKARKAISNFKLRENVPIGVMVTLRRERMWEFFDRLVNVALGYIMPAAIDEDPGSVGGGHPAGGDEPAAGSDRRIATRAAGAQPAVVGNGRRCQDAKDQHHAGGRFQ